MLESELPASRPETLGIACAVASGAAGSYIVTLTGDAGISTDLVIQPGQDVHISGTPGLTPSWGGGAFTVQAGGSLSLTGVVLGGSLTVRSGGSGSVSGGSLAFYTGDVALSPSTTLALDLQCYQPYIIVSDLWRASGSAARRNTRRSSTTSRGSRSGAQRRL